jgi:hypothetical protein
MADQIYSPVVSDEDDQSETPPVSELSIVDPVEFRRKPDDERGDLTVEEGVVQRSHRVDPESPEDAWQRPIVKHKVEGSGPISLNEAADATRWARGYALGQELATSGLSQSQIEAMAADAVERGERLDPLAPEPPKVEVYEHLGEDKTVLTPQEAADELTNWRARHQQEQQEALQELAGEAAEHAQAEAQQAEAQQQSAPQSQPPAPDPVQTEKAQLARERAWVTHLAKMSGHEAALRNDLNQLGEAIYQEFPSLRNGPPNPAHVEQLRLSDPARHQKLMMADQMVRERQQKILAVMQQQQAYEAQQTKAYEARVAEGRARQDAEFTQRAERILPNYEQRKGEIKEAALQTLQAAGLSREDIHNLWSGTGHLVDMHSAAAQELLLKAALYDRAQARAHQIRQAPVPPVMRPGTYRARDDGAQSVHELSARLSKASGREAIRLATELQRAKRARD